MDHIDQITEDLDLMDEDEAIKKSTEALIDLQNIVDEIQEKSGMNKTLAVAIEGIHPGLLDKNKYPVNSFTKDISKVNLEVALEGAIAGIGDLIAGILRAFWTAIKKVFSWICSLFSFFQKKTNTGAGRSILRSIELIKEIEELKKIDPAAADKIFKEVDASSKAKFEAIHSDFMSNVVNSESVPTALLALGGRYDTYVSRLNDKLSIVSKVNDIMSKDKNNERESQVLELLASQKKAISLENASAHVDRVIGKKTAGTLADSMTPFKDQLQALTESKKTASFEYKNVYPMLLSGKIRTDDLFIKDIKRASTNSENVLKKLDKIENSVGKNLKGSREMINDLRAACVEVRREAMGLGIIVGSIKMVDSHYTRFAGVINEVVGEHYKSLKSAVSK